MIPNRVQNLALLVLPSIAATQARNATANYADHYHRMLPTGIQNICGASYSDALSCGTPCPGVRRLFLVQTISFFASLIICSCQIVVALTPGSERRVPRRPTVLRWRRMPVATNNLAATYEESC